MDIVTAINGLRNALLNNHKVGTRDGEVDTPDLTVDTSAYAAGDNIGGLLSIEMEKFQSYWITGSRLVDGDNQLLEIKVHIFKEKPSTPTDNAAWAPTEADLQKKIATITHNLWNSINGNAWSDIDRKSIIGNCDSNGKIWIILEAGGALNFSTGNKLSHHLQISKN